MTQNQFVFNIAPDPEKDPRYKKAYSCLKCKGKKTLHWVMRQTQIGATEVHYGWVCSECGYNDWRRNEKDIE